MHVLKVCSPTVDKLLLVFNLEDFVVNQITFFIIKDCTNICIMLLISPAFLSNFEQLGLLHTLDLWLTNVLKVGCLYMAK